MLSSNSGIVLAFVVGALLHYTIVPFMGLAFSVTFLTSLCFLHESPQYLMAINQLDKAEKASVFYYGGVAINTDDKMEKQVETKVLPEKAKSDKITAADLRMYPKYSLNEQVKLKTYSNPLQVIQQP